MMSQEENGVMLTEFLEKSDSLVLVIYINQQGQLTPINDFPATSKNKVSYKLLDTYGLISSAYIIAHASSLRYLWVWLLRAHV